MNRHMIFSLLLIGAISSGAYSQSSEHEDVEIINPSETHPTRLGKADPAKAASIVVEQTNKFRKDNGRNPVKRDSRLDQAAQYFASYMAKNDKYGHNADGNRPAQRAEKFGYKYCIVLENIAYQYQTSDFATQKLGQQFFQGWKESPGHRKNMLDPDVTETGVAIAQSKESGYYYAVQMFGRPASKRIKFTFENDSSTTVTYRVGKRELRLPPRYRRTHDVCRPPEVTLTPAGQNKKEPLKKVKPADGSHYVIKQDPEGLRIKKK